MFRKASSILTKQRNHLVKQYAPIAFYSTPVAYKNITLEKQDNIAIVRLNRPKALNALCKDLVYELGTCVQDLEKDESVRCVVITGGEKAFAGMEKNIILIFY